MAVFSAVTMCSSFELSCLHEFQTGDQNINALICFYCSRVLFAITHIDCFKSLTPLEVNHHFYIQFGGLASIMRYFTE